jgi:hypothetical protein
MVRQAVGNLAGRPEDCRHQIFKGAAAKSFVGNDEADVRDDLPSHVLPMQRFVVGQAEQSDFGIMAIYVMGMPDMRTGMTAIVMIMMVFAVLRPTGGIGFGIEPPNDVGTLGRWVVYIHSHKLRRQYRMRDR